ncbi:hypothetical protein B0T25DRAFT_484271 [Lasiosphaeria hispida]|uniref:Mtf2-like C-terminal domain-containing protein n=1 Tax=Lasiosphaeria hispida TaxID=260671 RepID=A0AAJ0HB81_9PEZI|nr:hypothetical protein B0T25DRAFT_484271 [Lasiosphaeria hispida]
MSTTLLPFLYQTRTLQRLSRASISTPVLRAFHAAPSAAGKYNGPNSQYTAKDPIPFELPKDIDPIKEDEIEEESGPGHESTITPLEKRAFDRIFEEIAAREREALQVPPATPAFDEGPSILPLRRISKKFVPGLRSHEEAQAEKARKIVNIVVEDASDIYSNSWREVQHGFEQKNPVGQSTMARDHAKALLRFPPSLRKAARLALGAVNEDKRDDRSKDADTLYPWEQLALSKGEYVSIGKSQLGKTVQEELLRRDERNRVEQKMRSAGTDFELWDVIEEEVFPMVERLGLGEHQQQQKTAAKRGRKKAVPGATSGAGAGSEKLSVNIYGPLYPYHLLNALRLLDKSFNAPSSLALNILPRVKELGLASYVLGVSTPFYNALADIHWRRYGDPSAVFNLLEEMRYAGLYCDERTLSIVQSIQSVVTQSASGEKGPFVKEVMSLPEYEFGTRPRIKHWLNTIDVHLMEKERDLRNTGLGLYEQAAPVT